MKLPNKFEMCTKYNRATKYVMERLVNDMYKVTHEDGVRVERTTSNSEAFVKACIEEGSWIITKDMDEPELMFPFTVTAGSEPFEVTKGSVAGKVTCTYLHDGDKYENHCTVEEAKDFVKRGLWRVLAVSGRKPENFVGFADITADKITAANITLPEAPQSASKNLATLTINVDMGDALERVKGLTEAVEALNIAMESYIKLKEEVKNV